MALIHPWYLAGLLAIAIPVFIHLFELRRPKRVRFTNVSFIREVRIITARQRKLKHLLVLLARVGFIASLVFMFAQPFIPAAIEASNTAGVVQVMVDNSASMQAGSANEQPRFERAVTQARDLPVAFPANVRFVLDGSGPATALTGAAYQSAIDRLTVSGHSTGVNSLTGPAGRDAGLDKQLFIFSDFQKSTFPIRALRELDTAQQVFLVPVEGEPSHNVYVDSIWLDDAFVRRNLDVVLHIRLRNGGEQVVENCPVKLMVGSRQATAFSARVAPQEPTVVTARVRVEGTLAQRCRVELDDYPVTFDNTFHFTLQASPTIRVLEVAGTPERTLQRVYGNEPLFAYTRAAAASPNYQELEKANLVIVQEPARVEAALRESLRRVVQRGGSVVVVPTAEPAGRSSYDQLFRELGIGAVQWEAAGSRVGVREVAVPDRRNPFFRDVFGAPSRQPVLPKVAPVLRWSRSGNDILRMQDGDGFLAAFGSGKGTVYLFSAPFSGPATDFAQHALFVPVMYRLAMQSFRREQQLAYRLNQGTVTVNVTAEPAAQSEQVYKLTNDSLSFIPAQRLQDGVLRFEVPASMREPGFYRLMRGTQAVATLAFNNDKRESELAAYSAQELRQLIGPNRPNVQVYETGQGTTAAARYKAERVGTPLWQYFLWAALAFLLAEVLLLRFAGRSAAVEPAAVAA